MSRNHFGQRARDYANDIRQRGDGDFSTTEHLLTKGLRHYPDNPYLMVYLGNLYRDVRHDAKAMEVFRRAFVRHPYEQVAIMGYANFLTLKSEFGMAEDVYAHMFSLNGRYDMRLLTALGHLYQVSGNKPFAAACFGRASMLPHADDYAHLRYKEICKIFSPGFMPEEWENVLKRMAGRKGCAVKFHRRRAAADAAESPQKPQSRVDPADRDGPVHNGPARS